MAVAVAVAVAVAMAMAMAMATRARIEVGAKGPCKVGALGALGKEEGNRARHSTQSTQRQSVR